jgi:hypothetical protein
MMNMMAINTNFIQQTKTIDRGIEIIGTRDMQQSFSSINEPDGSRRSQVGNILEGSKLIKSAAAHDPAAFQALKKTGR